MIDLVIKGKTHVYGDNIDTDAIIPGKYTKTLDRQIFAQHVLEDLDPDFRNKVQPGDILVAGANFGCGSSREQAPLSLKAVGISAVIANFFARIFFRNAVNIGLPVFEIKNHDIQSGQDLEIQLEKGLIINHSTNQFYQALPLPPVMLDILNAGGLAAYLKKNSQMKVASK